ncbi:hypothetical protein WN943_016116 [Citrus x changshan-huyou]
MVNIFHSLALKHQNELPDSEQQIDDHVVQIGVCLASSEIRYNAGTSLSADANTLLLLAEFFVASRDVLPLATISNLLSILGTRFPEKAMLWLTAALIAVPIAALPFAVYESILKKPCFGLLLLFVQCQLLPYLLQFTNRFDRSVNTMPKCLILCQHAFKMQSV